MEAVRKKQWHTEGEQFPDTGNISQQHDASRREQNSQHCWENRRSLLETSECYSEGSHISSVVKNVFVVVAMNAVILLFLTNVYIAPEIRRGMDLLQDNIYEGTSVIILNAVLFMLTLAAMSFFAASLCVISVLLFMFRFSPERSVVSSLGFR
jgi:hypothetical protein